MQFKHIGWAVASLFFVFTLAASAQANLDLTFGSGGKVVSSPDGSEITFGQDYALLPDGKIIAAGGGSNFGLLVVRYNTNGSLDTSFGTNGLGSITFPGQSVTAVAVDIQTDGKIVVGGTVSRVVNNQTANDFAVARFNANGTPDTTFDTDGKMTFSFVPELINNPLARENLSSLKIMPDGKIIVGGSAGVLGPGESYRLVFAKLTADGSLDTNFDVDGRLLGSDGFTNLNDLTVLPDGSFVAVGSETNGLVRFACKYNSAGGLVWTYYENETNIFTSRLYGVAAQPDGKLIVVGKRSGRITAIRLNADGSNDTTFAAPLLEFGTAVSVAVQPDGKIAANFTLSTTPNDTRNSFNIVRYNANGSLDTSFGNGGIFYANASSGVDYGDKILVQTDGKILVGGYSAFTNPTRYFFSMLRVTGNSATARRTLFDYDGDGKADVSVYRPSGGTWYLNNSTGGFAGVAFGVSTDTVVPADYDGDGKTDVAVFRDGLWYVLRSFDNAFSATAFGQTGDVPVPADFDGDSRADQAVYRGGTWYLNRSTLGFRAVSFGAATDKPVPADYDGDGKADIAVYRPSNGTWYRINSLNNAFSGISFGIASDAPVPADYDGDGKTDTAVFRAATGDWYRLNSTDNAVVRVNTGSSTDKPVAADYDGDGRADIAVYRPSGGIWNINQSTAGFKAVSWGISSDTPTPNAYVR